jgi:tRNA pseudouridine55 synthase
MAATSTDGFILVDKPAGVTSHDAVSSVRRALAVSRAGHTGTLDPFATGLLIILLEGGTRLARFVPNEPKVYEAEVHFGYETDTDDATGKPTLSAEPPLDAAVQVAMERLTGRIEQVPPMFSAKQVAGRRAYALARAGKPAHLQPAKIEVMRWEVLSHESARWRVRIACGSGTYVRALARDLGRLARSAAHLATLRRTRIGPFDVAHAVGLGAVRDTTQVVPAVDVLAGIPRIRLTEHDVAAVRHGRTIAATIPESRAALVDEAGKLVAVAERENERWQPRLVLSGA